MIRKLGTFVEFSVVRGPVTVDWTIIGNTKELNVHGAHLSPTATPSRSACSSTAASPWGASSPTA